MLNADGSGWWAMRSRQRIVCTMPWIRKHARRAEEGQDIVEYMLILPFLLLLTFTIIEAGWLVFRYNSIANAAREGARAGIIPVSATCDLECVKSQADSAARVLTVGLQPAPTVEVEILSSSAPTVSVTVEFDAPLITGPMIEAVGGTSTIVLFASATMQRE